MSIATTALPPQVRTSRAEPGQQADATDGTGFADVLAGVSASARDLAAGSGASPTAHTGKRVRPGTGAADDAVRPAPDGAQPTTVTLPAAQIAAPASPPPSVAATSLSLPADPGSAIAAAGAPGSVSGQVPIAQSTVPLDAPVPDAVSQASAIPASAIPASAAPTAVAQKAVAVSAESGALSPSLPGAPAPHEPASAPRSGAVTTAASAATAALSMATNPDAVTGTPTDARPTGATAAAPTTPVAPAPLADATQEPSIATSAPIPAALQPAPISGRTDTGRATAPAGPSAAVPAAVVPLPASAESGAPAPAASAAPSKATPSTPAQDLSLTAVAQATAQAAPAAPPTVTVAPAPPTASAAPTPPAFHVFAGQVARPVFTLAAAGDGNHTMTISVTPDNLGPVTVRAHISGENVRIELFSPSDNGRDALRQLLPDLRRDLSATGANANVDLSSQGRPDAQPNTGTPRDDPRGRDHGGNRPRSPAAASAALSVTPANLPPVGSPTGLDVLA